MANFGFASLAVLSFALIDFGLLAAPPAGDPAPAPATPPKSVAFTWTNPGPGLVGLKYLGRPILVYASGTNQFKPYVRELYTLSGDNVLLDAPFDHLHHHGVMYAIRVNGINFWEEREQAGVEKPCEPPQTASSTGPSGLPQASLKQVIEWLPGDQRSRPDSRAAALLIETRSLTVTVDEEAQEVALAWHADFEVGSSAKAVTLTGSNYNGLGVRLPPAFNLVAVHQNSEGAGYPTKGTGDVTAARWSSVFHDPNGHPITVALFGQPSPTRGPASFFTMVKPFTYLAVTQGLDKAPLQYSAGDQFKIDYLLVVYGQSKTPEFLNQRYNRWKP